LAANGYVKVDKESTNVDSATKAVIEVDKVIANTVSSDQVNVFGILRIPLFGVSSPPNGAIWME
jgi:hypothetical protein